MYRASNILQTARLDKEYSVEEIAVKLKIPVKYLRAFETEEKKNFPSEPYCSLMVKDYASHLGLNSNYILSLFNRDFDVKANPVKLRREKFGFTPQFTFVCAIYAGIFLFLAYLAFEYYQFNSPPLLKVNWPQSPLVGESIEISGKTSMDATVKVNDDLIVVDQDGKFIKNLKLPIKDNRIKIEAQSPSGKISKDEKVF